MTPEECRRLHAAYFARHPLRVVGRHTEAAITEILRRPYNTSQCPRCGAWIPLTHLTQ